MLYQSFGESPWKMAFHWPWALGAEKMTDSHHALFSATFLPTARPPPQLPTFLVVWNCHPHSLLKCEFCRTIRLPLIEGCRLSQHKCILTNSWDSSRVSTDLIVKQAKLSARQNRRAVLLKAWLILLLKSVLTRLEFQELLSRPLICP